MCSVPMTGTYMLADFLDIGKKTTRLGLGKDHTLGSDNYIQSKVT